MKPTRKDLLRLIDGEGAWLEFLEQTNWFSAALKNKSPILEQFERAEEIESHRSSLEMLQRVAKTIIHKKVSTTDLREVVSDWWDEYPPWWLNKYGQ
jgi:hypothetical protein